jgi:hypothetical protein
VEGLEQLVLRDVREHTGSSVAERSVKAEVAREAEILEDAPLGEAGPLLGWVKFIAKPQAEVLLTLGDDPKDPLLTRWQYGLGRSAVFASDAKDRWAVEWVKWPGFDRFWSNVVRDLLPRAFSTEVETHYVASADQIVVSYQLSPARLAGAPSVPPELYVFEPDGSQRTVPLEKITAGHFEARVPAGGRYGLFRFRAASDIESFPEAAFYRESPELEEYGSNAALLERAAAFTGGRLNPGPAAIFDAGGRSLNRAMELWPGLLFLAIVLNFVELADRKGWLPRWGRVKRWGRV